jgi:hypothetical protein
MARRSKKTVETILSVASATTTTTKEDFEVQRKITLATEGFTTTKFCELILRDRSMLSKESALTISEYIIAMKREAGLGRGNTGKPLTTGGLEQIYKYYKEKFFPKLLADPTVSYEDKDKIKNLLAKPFNPYIRRHSALTEKSTKLKSNSLNLACWLVYE